LVNIENYKVYTHALLEFWYIHTGVKTRKMHTKVFWVSVRLAIAILMISYSNIFSSKFHKFSIFKLKVSHAFLLLLRYTFFLLVLVFTGMGSLSLLQWIFPTQESNWGLLHCRRILYHLSYQGSPVHVQIYLFGK
jgi:hypothetical protein